MAAIRQAVVPRTKVSPRRPLVHEFLVELPQALAVRAVDPKDAAVGDGARAAERGPGRPRPGAHGAGLAVPAQQGAQPARPQVGLDGLARLPGDGPVVGAGKVLPGQGVEAPSQGLGAGPVGHEADGRAVRPHVAQDQGGDRVPHRVPRQVAEVRDRHAHAQCQRPWRAAVDDLDGVAAPQEGGDRRQGALGRGQPDPLRDAPAGRADAEALQPLQGERQVGPALAAGQGVDLIDDDRLDGGQRGQRPRRGQEEEQRLRGGDQDVRGEAQLPPPRGGGRVARAHGDRGQADGLPAQRGRGGDARQRRLQVAVDVVVQGLQRREVEGADASAGGGGLRGGVRTPRRPLRPPAGAGPRGRGGDRLAHQAVDGRQEGGQRLAAAGRRAEQDVPPRGQQGPGRRLGGRGDAQGAAEPGRDGRVEGGQRVRGRGVPWVHGALASPPPRGALCPGEAGQGRAVATSAGQGGGRGGHAGAGATSRPVAAPVPQRPQHPVYCVRGGRG